MIIFYRLALLLSIVGILVNNSMAMASSEIGQEQCWEHCSPVLVLDDTQNKAKTYIVPIYDYSSFISALELVEQLKSKPLPGTTFDNTKRIEVIVAEATDGPKSSFSGQNQESKKFVEEIRQEVSAQGFSGAILSDVSLDAKPFPITDVAFELTRGVPNSYIFQVGISKLELQGLPEDENIASLLKDEAASSFSLSSDSSEPPPAEAAQQSTAKRSLYERAIKPYLTKNVIMTITAGLSSVTTTTLAITIATGLPVRTAILAGVFAGSFAAGFQYWAEAYYKWIGGTGWIGTNSATGDKSLRNVKMTLKRGFVGAVYISLYRIVSSAIGLIKPTSLIDHVGSIVKVTATNLVVGFPWSKALSNIANDEGRPLPGPLKRIFGVTTFGLMLSISFDIARVLSLVEGMGRYAAIQYGSIAAAGTALLVYQVAPSPSTLVQKVKSVVKNTANSIGCGLLYFASIFRGG